MNIIVCLDDKNGMMFNKRRQSQDKVLRSDIKDETKDSTLFMNKYSYKLYSDIDNGNIKVCEDYFNKCGDTDFCLVEDKTLINYTDKINTIIAYSWNRIYPSDLHFDINLNNDLWELISEEDFKGSSHEKITKRIYRRKL